MHAGKHLRYLAEISRGMREISITMMGCLQPIYADGGESPRETRQ